MKPLLVILVCLIIINVPPLKWVISLFDHQNINYANKSGSFTFAEMNAKDVTYQDCMNRWQAFKKSGNIDTQLFRITPKNYMFFWNYGAYFLSEKYAHPYKSWESIEVNRNSNKPISGFQDF